MGAVRECVFLNAKNKGDVGTGTIGEKDIKEKAQLMHQEPTLMGLLRSPSPQPHARRLPSPGAICAATVSRLSPSPLHRARAPQGRARDRHHQTCTVCITGGDPDGEPGKNLALSCENTSSPKRRARSTSGLAGACLTYLKQS